MTTDLTEGADPASVALGRVLDGLRELGELPAWQLADAGLGEAFSGLTRVTRLAEGQTVRLAAEAGSRGLPAQRGHARLEHWIRELVPTTSPRAASAQARRAERLFTSSAAAELEPTRTSLLSGELSSDQVDVVASTVEALSPPSCPAGTVGAETLAEAQSFLLAQAEVFEPSQLRRLATHLRHRLDPGADERLARDGEARERARSLTIVTEASGMVHLSGSLTPECGAALSTAIDSLSAPLPAADGTPDPRNAAQRRHDGVQQLAERAIATPGMLSSTHGSAYRVVVTVPHDTLTATLSGDGAAGRVTGLRPATLTDGTALSSDELATLACDADLVAVLVDDAGNPLDVGDTQRSFPARQRTAIAHRDQTCSYPGCSAPPPWCHAHHIVPFKVGGATSVQNGALLCGRHHRYVHKTGATASIVEGQVVWDVGAPAARAPNLTRANQLLDDLARRWRARRQQ